MIIFEYQNTTHHSKSMAIRHGISFALHDKWLLSFIINEFLETSNKDIDIPMEIKKKKPEENKRTQVTSKN